MNIFWYINTLLILIMGVIEKVNNFICKKGPHEHI